MLKSSSIPPRIRRSDETSPMKRVDSSVLPPSPPQVTSPPLEAQLFFRSVSPAFDSTPKLELNPISEVQHSSISSPGLGKRPNKLHTKRPPPNLPFPPSVEYNRTPNRLAKKPVGGAVLSTSPRSNPPIVSPERTQSTAERLMRTDQAIVKVDRIVAQSRSARNLRGQNSVKSPAVFGALP